MSTHLDRKTLKRPDAFLERAGGLMGYVADNAAAFAVALGILFLAGLGFAFYKNYAGHRAEEADSALFEARKALDDVATKPDWATSAKPALEQLEKVTHDFNGTRAAFEAELVLGDAYLKHGAPAAAIEAYEKAASKPRPRSARATALDSLAYAYEASKNYDAAIQSFHEVVADGNPAFKIDALMGLGRNFALKGDKPKAIEAYDQVSKEYPSSPLAKQAAFESARLRK